ncbi:MAG: hypothetical protein KatS3mg129_1688 [Leptospiraceae bacterium]|nr:MAG: hypothetical protein KatS3mg129_1688 [Leptospiraceae bacterium]
MLFLMGIFILILFLISNPQEVSFHFLMWKSTYRLYEVILFGIIYGSILYILLSGHIKDVLRKKKER